MSIQLTSLDQLQQGTRILARFSRRDNEEGTAPDWGVPQVVTLYVRRREKTLKLRGEVHPAGEIIELAVEEFGWATYDERDYCSEFKEFLVENWRMQILEVLE